MREIRVYYRSNCLRQDIHGRVYRCLILISVCRTLFIGKNFSIIKRIDLHLRNLLSSGCFVPTVFSFDSKFFQSEIMLSYFPEKLQ